MAKTKEKKEVALKSSVVRPVLISALATEKCVRLIESDNILTFIVEGFAKKKDIREAVEKMFNVKVANVNVLNIAKGKKKTYVKLTKDYLAADVSADLGFI
tara:strand:- start:78 stop:380 length:303 start_codon:yes stop_codon:yes gene_type:complete